MAIAHWKVTAGYGLLQALVGAGAMALWRYGSLPVLSFLAACFTAFCLFSQKIRSIAEGDGS